MDDSAVKIKFRIMQSTVRELKHIAADKNVSNTYVLNDALNRYIESHNISTFQGDKIRDDVAELS